MLQSDIFKTIRGLAPVLKAAGVVRLGIFGSMSRGEARQDSDLDVLVELEPSSRTYDNLYTIGASLEEAFHRRIDLVTKDSLSKHIGPKILREVKYVEL